MATRDDDEFTPLDRLLDGSGDDGSGEEPWVRARAVQLVRSVDPFPVSPSGKGGSGKRPNGLEIRTEAAEEPKHEAVGGPGAREQ